MQSAVLGEHTQHIALLPEIICNNNLEGSTPGNQLCLAKGFQFSAMLSTNRDNIARKLICQGIGKSKKQYFTARLLVFNSGKTREYIHSGRDRWGLGSDGGIALQMAFVAVDHSRQTVATSQSSCIDTDTKYHLIMNKVLAVL